MQLQEQICTEAFGLGCSQHVRERLWPTLLRFLRKRERAATPEIIGLLRYQGGLSTWPQL